MICQRVHFEDVKYGHEVLEAQLPAATPTRYDPSDTAD